jgi:hypothetical protein
LRVTEPRARLEALSLFQLSAILSKTCVEEGSFKWSAEGARTPPGILPRLPPALLLQAWEMPPSRVGSILVGAYTFQDSQPANGDEAPASLQRMNFGSSSGGVESLGSGTLTGH